MRLWGPERFDPNVVDRKALEAAVNALSEKWKPRRRTSAVKIDVKRQSKGPQSYAYRRSDPRTIDAEPDYARKERRTLSGHVFAATAHGRIPNFAFVDELHEFKKGDLYYAITSGLNKNSRSLLFIATTAGVGQTTIAWDLYEYAKRVADGTVVDDHRG